MEVAVGTNLQRACGQLGAAVRYGWTDEELGELRQRLVAVQLEEAIADGLSAVPALGMVHRRRLAALILPDGVGTA